MWTKNAFFKKALAKINFLEKSVVKKQKKGKCFVNTFVIEKPYATTEKGFTGSRQP